jgi:hypothetical protein
MGRTSKIWHNRRRLETEERSQEVSSFKEAIIAILPRDFQTVLQAFITLTCLYTFLQTRDAIWLLTAYTLAGGTTGLPILKTLLPAQKEYQRLEDETKKP